MELSLRFLDSPLVCGDCGLQLDVGEILRNGAAIFPAALGALMLQFRMTQQHGTMCVATCVVMKN